MKYSVGDTVTIIAFKRDGVVVEILSDETYRVTLGSLPIVVKESDLAPASQSKIRSKPKKSEVTVQTSARQGDEKEELDLHGHTVADALNLLEAKLNRAILTKLHRVKIVHGLGSGRVKEAVQQYLAGSTMVSAYKIDEFNPGVTWVYL